MDKTIEKKTPRKKKAETYPKIQKIGRKSKVVPKKKTTYSVVDGGPGVSFIEAECQSQNKQIGNKLQI